MTTLVFKSKLPLLVFFLLIISFDAKFVNGESSTCLTVYKEGGAPAVFHSPKCPRWKLADDNFQSHSTSHCQSAMLQGRRKYQEDRVLCALDLMIPFPSNIGLKEVTIGIVGVFDGHNGAEASEMTSKLLLEYFALHTYFLLDAIYSVMLKQSTGTLPNMGEKDIIYQVLNWDEKLGRHGLNFERLKYSLPANLDDSFHLEILKEALMRAIHDIDATFSKEAARNNLHSGSTAVVVLLVDGKILVANVGDSKALLCSEKFQPPAEAKATLLRLYRNQRLNEAISPARDYNKPKFRAENGLTRFTVKALTRDHHPDRDDERSRVETAGGYVLKWGGVPRINGQLAVSRSIGDLPFKSYGVISLPELTGWQALTANDSYLIVSSDGVFENLSLQDVCDLLWEVHTQSTVGSRFPPSCSHSLADLLVNTAFERGSMDNMAAVVIPLESTHLYEHLLRERCLEDRDMYSPCKGLQKFTHKQSEHDIGFGHSHLLTAKFDRLLVEGKRGSLCSFYLSENLNDFVDHTSMAQTEYVENYAFDTSQALPDNLEHHHGGLLKSFKDQNMCLHFGMTIDGNKDQCVNPEGFASFLSLLESIPFHDVGLDYGSKEYAMPDSRYVLKRRFGRGSYGEVWLAFPWNCDKDNNGSGWAEKNKDIPTDTIHKESKIRNSHNSSSGDDCSAGCSDDRSFILKRIMVERGPAVYLSGLREKYFGEVFLNASTWLGDLHLTGTVDAFEKEEKLYFNDTKETNKSMFDDIGSSWTFGNIFTNKFKLQRTFFEEGLNHIARYVESFESRSNEIWLVFRHEGMSLKKLLYAVEEPTSGPDMQKTDGAKCGQVLHASKWWHWLKTTEAGQEEMRNLIRQLLMSLKACHDRNITHRDIKPENMVICFEEQDTGRCLKRIPDGNKSFTTRMRIIDFGSAIDEFTLKHLYGSGGPSRAEQTYEYIPPEALLNASWYQGLTKRTLKYDMWSVGVVMLELILGSPDVFQISSRTQALLDQHLEGWNDDLKELAYKLRSLMELCILIPGSSMKHKLTTNESGFSLASWKCSEDFFSQQIKSRDPLKQGFPNIWALRLVRQLLAWDPDDRPSVDDALRHPYFQHS